MQTAGLTVVADKLNFCRFLSHFRCIHRGSFFTEMRTTAVRKLLPEAWGDRMLHFGFSCFYSYICVLLQSLCGIFFNDTNDNFPIYLVLLFRSTFHLPVYVVLCWLNFFMFYWPVRLIVCAVVLPWVLLTEMWHAGYFARHWYPALTTLSDPDI